MRQKRRMLQDAGMSTGPASWVVSMKSVQLVFNGVEAVMLLTSQSFHKSLIKEYTLHHILNPFMNLGIVLN